MIIFSCHRTIIKTKTRPLNIHFHLDIWFHFNFDTISIGKKYTCASFLTINFQSSNKETRTNVNFNFVYQAILNEWYFVIFFKNNRSNNIYSVVIKIYKNSLVRFFQNDRKNFLNSTHICICIIYVHMYMYIYVSHIYVISIVDLLLFNSCYFVSEILTCMWILQHL